MCVRYLASSLPHPHFNYEYRACEPTPKERKMADDAAARQDFRHNNPGFEGEILDVRKHVHIDLGEAVVMDQSGIKALDDVIGMVRSCDVGT